MSGVVEIFNLSLSSCGVEIGVASPDENSREAALCRLWYPRVRDNVIAAAPWPSAMKTARLAKLAEQDTENPWSDENPHPKFQYAHAVPADLLRPYCLDNYFSFAYQPYKTTKALHSNMEFPILHYNARVEDTSMWSQDLRLAVVHTLATYLAMPLTGSRERLNDNASLAFSFVETAQAAAANSQEMQDETMPKWLSTRGYSEGIEQRYFYPQETLAVGAI